MGMNLARRLAENIRRRRGHMSQVAFAKKVQIGRSTINRIEIEEQNVSLKTLEQLCKALKCDIGDLFN